MVSSAIGTSTSGGSTKGTSNRLCVLEVYQTALNNSKERFSCLLSMFLLGGLALGESTAKLNKKFSFKLFMYTYIQNYVCRKFLDNY